MPESKEVKFTSDEMDRLNKLQQDYASTQIKFGQLGFAKMKIEGEISVINTKEDELKKDFFEIQKAEQEFIKEITKKYGDGILDPKTGVFNLNKNK